MYPVNVLKKATYLRVRFFFDKGGTGNLQEQTFCRFPSDRSSFPPLLAAICALDRWTSCDLDPLTPIFWYWKVKWVTFIHDSVVTKKLCKATLQAYPNPHHFYKLYLKYILTHSVQVITCLILVVAKLSDANTEHRLHWSSSAWKLYVREILSHISHASTSSFYTSLGTYTENHDDTYTLQEYDGDDIL